MREAHLTATGPSLVGDQGPESTGAPVRACRPSGARRGPATAGPNTFPSSALDLHAHGFGIDLDGLEPASKGSKCVTTPASGSGAVSLADCSNSMSSRQLIFPIDFNLVFANGIPASTQYNGVWPPVDPPRVPSSSTQNHQCLDVYLDLENLANDPLDNFQCNATGAQWLHFDINHNLKTPSGTCVTAAGTGVGSVVQVAACNGSAAQQWTYAYPWLFCLQSLTCMDVLGQSNAPTAQVVLSNCATETPNGQTWYANLVWPKPSLFTNSPPARVSFWRIDPDSLLTFTGLGYPGNAKRSDIVAYSLAQLNPNPDGTRSKRGACGDTAENYYQGDDLWCSEFARDMYLWRHDVQNLCYCALQALVCLNNVCVSDINEVSDWKNMFQHYGGWLERGSITKNTAEPGDYLTMVGSQGDHFEHSAVIVAVSSDARWVFTMEGNVIEDDGQHCVGFEQRDYFVNGTLASNLDAIGKINVLF